VALDDDGLPPDPTPGALLARAAAERLADQTNPAIWFDSWYNDERDNDLDGRIDGASEKASDGAHYARTMSGRIAPLAMLTTDQAPSWSIKTIDVTYKVCIDIPIESYRAAHVPISKQRWIPGFFNELKHLPGWRVWDHGNHPETLMDGDIVAAQNASHQHAGIVKTGYVYDSVINLPGPTSARRYGSFSPSGLNDIRSVARSLFELVLGIDCYARWIMPSVSRPNVGIRRP
jgi:hypothetical protein